MRYLVRQQKIVRALEEAVPVQRARNPTMGAAWLIYLIASDVESLPAEIFWGFTHLSSLESALFRIVGIVRRGESAW